MRRLLSIITLILLLSQICPAQNSKKVKALQKQKTELQNVLKKSQAELDKTKKQVATGQKSIKFLGQQLDDRLNYIRQLEKDMDTLETEITKVQDNIQKVDGELKAKRAKLKQAIRYARTQRENNSTLVFVLSAETVTQMYRRARYAKEYVGYQKALGEQILKKQAELLTAQNQLLEHKSKKNNLLREVMIQRKQLNQQQVQQQKKVDVLKKQETGLAGKVKEQQKQIAALDKKIDDLIAYEIEQARKRAEEAARKKAAEEAARKKKSQKSSSSSSSKSKNTKSSSSSSSSATTTTSSTPKKGSWMTAEERQLNGTFEQNKGRLPVPITGQYMLGNRFGIYNVPGLKNVQLDNKGTNYVGKSGARARAIFDGEVTAVFQFGGTKNILIRHGSYISVYCNLSSVIVAKGQKVHTRDVIGTVLDDGSGNCVLHFQLRKETTKLNPEAWIGR